MNPARLTDLTSKSKGCELLLPPLGQPGDESKGTRAPGDDRLVCIRRSHFRYLWSLGIPICDPFRKLASGKCNGLNDNEYQKHEEIEG